MACKDVLRISSVLFLRAKLRSKDGLTSSSVLYQKCWVSCLPLLNVAIVCMALIDYLNRSLWKIYTVLAMNPYDSILSMMAFCSLSIDPIFSNRNNITLFISPLSKMFGAFTKTE